MEVVGTIVVLVVVLTGLAGIIIPFLPGILLIWAGIVGYGFVAGFDAIGIGVIVIATVLSAIGVVLGFVLPQQAADAAGASKKSQLAGVLGAVVGFFVIPVVGVLIGAVAGIALAEYAEKNDWGPAWRSTKGILTGMGAAVLAQFLLGSIMIMIWAGWAAITVL